MAKKSVPKAAPKSKPLKGKKWSELKPGTQKKYKAAGVTPAKFNAWRRPDVRAKAKREGKQRWEVIGLPSPNKVSGKSTPGQIKQLREEIYARFENAFGDRPKFRPEGVRHFISKLHLARIDSPQKGEQFKPQSVARLQRWLAMSDEELMHEAKYPAGGNSNDYIQYH